MKHRTTQDLLAERRANIQEARRSDCEITKATLAAQVAILDAELGYRRYCHEVDRIKTNLK